MIPHLPEKDAYTLVEIAEHFGVPVDTVLSWARQQLIACCIWLKKQRATCYNPFQRSRPDQDMLDVMQVRGIEGLHRIPASKIAEILMDGACVVSPVYPESIDYTVHSTECHLSSPIEVTKVHLLISRLERDRFEKTWQGGRASYEELSLASINEQRQHALEIYVAETGINPNAIPMRLKEVQAALEQRFPKLFPVSLESFKDYWRKHQTVCKLRRGYLKKEKD